MHDITEPLIISTGSHEAGSGRGCSMNVLSWCLGEETISDCPKGVDTRLAVYVQLFNDACGEYAGNVRMDAMNPMTHTAHEMLNVSDELLPAHAAQALDLAFMTIGTSNRPEGSPINPVWEAVIADAEVEFVQKFFGRGLAYAEIELRDSVFDSGVQDLVKMEAQVRFIITRFRFHAGLDRPTIPAPGLINEALRKMSEQVSA